MRELYIKTETDWQTHCNKKNCPSDRIIVTKLTAKHDTLFMLDAASEEWGETGIFVTVLLKALLSADLSIVCMCS